MSEKWNYFFAAVAGGLVTGIFLLAFGAIYVDNLLYNMPRQQQVILPNVSTNEEAVVTSVFAEVKDSVAHVTSTTLERDFFLRPIPVEGTGSGVIIDSRGYILTNNHVVENAQKLTVVLANGDEFEATVVGTDIITDLAVIKISAPYALKAARLGNSDELKPGQLAIAIGSPYRLDNTVTVGVISALNRTLETENNYEIKGVIQTDAAINPGNSGGPLLNARGEVIGINTAIYSPIRGSIGIGFAIPVNTAKKVASDLIERGKVVRPWLGITYDSAANYKDTLNLSIAYGALIVGVVKDSPAEKAGLRGSVVKNNRIVTPGDIIIELGGEKINTTQKLIEALLKYRVGDTVELKYVREGKEYTTKVTLGERPKES